MNMRHKQSLQDAKMLFTSKELAFAAGASSPNLFLNNIGRYNFRISAEKRIRGANSRGQCKMLLNFMQSVASLGLPLKWLNVSMDTITLTTKSQF